MSMFDCIIREKPISQAIIDHRKETFKALISEYEKRKDSINEIIFVGSGSSNTSSTAAYQTVEKFSGISTTTILPNIFMNKTVYNLNALYVFISQTGSSTLTQQAVIRIRELGGLTAAMSEKEGTKVANEAEIFINMGCGDEEYGMRTIGFNSTVLTELMMGLEIGLCNGHISEEQYNAYIEEAQRMVDHHDYVLEATTKWYERVKPELADCENYFILGAKSLYGIALEGALKIYEVVRRYTATGYEMDDGLHGPNMGLKKETIVIALSDGVSNQDLVHGITNYVKNEVGKAYIIGKNGVDENDFEFNFVTENFISLEFAPIVQILAYRLAVDFGVEVPLFKDLYLPDQKYFNTHSEHLGKK